MSENMVSVDAMAAAAQYTRENCGRWRAGGYSLGILYGSHGGGGVFLVRSGEADGLEFELVVNGAGDVYRACQRPDCREPGTMYALGFLCAAHLAAEQAARAAQSTELERDPVIYELRRALRERSGRAWSVTGGRGTSWGWITITAPPSRRDRFDCMSKEDAAELARLLGLDHAHEQGVMVPAGSDYRREYLDRAHGHELTATGRPYWD